jgi:hypothetical protein
MRRSVMKGNNHRTSNGKKRKCFCRSHRCTGRLVHPYTFQRHTIDDLNLDDQQLDEVSSIQPLPGNDNDIASLSCSQAMQAIPSSDVNTDPDCPVEEDTILFDAESSSSSSDQDSLLAAEESSDASRSVDHIIESAESAASSGNFEFKFDLHIMHTMTKARAMLVNSSITRENQLSELGVKTSVHLETIKIKIMQFADQLLRSGVNKKCFDELLSSYLLEMSTSTDSMTAEAIPLYDNFPETWKEAKASILRDIFLQFKPMLLYSCPDGHCIFAVELESEQECPHCHTPRNNARTFLYWPISYDIQVLPAWFRLANQLSNDLDPICIRRLE